MVKESCSLVEIVRSPPRWIYEAIELTDQGRCYLYRYDPLEGVFYRATVPAGAASPHFRPLSQSDKIPLGGWVPIEAKHLPDKYLRLVGRPRQASA